MADLAPQREDFEHALQSMATFLDVSADDLVTLYARARQFARQRHTETLVVAAVMSREPHTVPADTTLAEAARRMLAARISGLPVVNAAGRLLGVITEADFLSALGVPAHTPSQNVWQTLETLFHHLDAATGFDDPQSPVAAHMTRDVVCIEPEADLHAALRRMAEHRVKRLVVCDTERRPVGMLTRSDLMRVFFQRQVAPSANDEA